MNKHIFQMLTIAASDKAYNAMNPAILLIDTGAEPEERLTLKIKLISDVASGLVRIIAALLVDKTHDLLMSDEVTPALEAEGCKIVSGLSPEVLLFAALFVHFQDKGRSENPVTDALAMLKTLGHEIPEELIPGVRP